MSFLATDEMGIGNTTTASAVASVLLGCEPEVITGRGAGLSDEGLAPQKGGHLSGYQNESAKPGGPAGQAGRL